MAIQQAVRGDSGKLVDKWKLTTPKGKLCLFVFKLNGMPSLMTYNGCLPIFRRGYKRYAIRSVLPVDGRQLERHILGVHPFLLTMVNEGLVQDPLLM